MVKKSINVTEAELAVLEVLWQAGPSTIRQLTNAIYKEGTNSEYATVQKLLDRLMDKGCVNKSRESRAHAFSARISREEMIGSGLETLAEKLCRGSLTPLLIHLTGKVQLSKSDRDALRQLIEDSEQ